MSELRPLASSPIRTRSVNSNDNFFFPVHAFVNTRRAPFPAAQTEDRCQMISHFGYYFYVLNSKTTSVGDHESPHRTIHITARKGARNTADRFAMILNPLIVTCPRGIVAKWRRVTKQYHYYHYCFGLRDNGRYEHTSRYCFGCTSRRTAHRFFFKLLTRRAATFERVETETI